MLLPSLLLAVLADNASDSTAASRAEMLTRLQLLGHCACTPQERDALFERLASAQRGAPERAMGAIQHSQIGQLYGWCCEHTGDLTHRMSQKYSWFRGYYEGVHEKVRKVLREMRKPRFSRDVAGQIRSNVEYMAEKQREEDPSRPFPGTVAEATAELERLGKAYADEHRKLVVYNRVQSLAKTAAIRLGQMDFEGARLMLTLLEMEIEKGRPHWEAVAGECDPLYETHRDERLRREADGASRRGR